MVNLFVRATRCGTDPIDDLAVADFTVLEDGQPVGPIGGVTRILPSTIGVERFTLVLVERGPATSTPEAILALQRTIEDFVDGTVSTDAPHRVAIGVLGARGARFLAPFSDDAARLHTAIAGIVDEPVAAGVDLYGGIVSALGDLDDAVLGSAAGIRGGALVVLTGGVDHAGQTTLGAVTDAVTASASDVYVVMLGDDGDRSVLEQIGRAGLSTTPAVQGLAAAFAPASAAIEASGRGYHVVSHCSPSRSGEHTLSVQVRGGPAATFRFNSRGFANGCSYETLATQCGPRECGGVAGLVCGRCGDGEQCSTAGACFETCGDGIVTVSETCDDGNAAPDDGCGTGCAREPGWQCPVAGEPCNTICGDGLRRGTEGCDDGDTEDGDGCGAGCVAEPGYDCLGSGPGSCSSGPFPPVDFSAVLLACASGPRLATVFNASPRTVSVGEPFVDPGSSPFVITSTSNAAGWPLALAPGASLSIAVEFTPRDETLALAQLVVPDSAPESPPLARIALRGRGTTVVLQEDVHALDALPAVDILFVIDDSGSMNDEQELLTTNFDRFFSVSGVVDTDFHIAVTSTLGPEYTCSQTSTVCPEDPLSGYFTSCSDERFLTRASVDPEAQFSCNARVSQQLQPARARSDFAEAGLRAAMNFLTPPHSIDPDVNGGFLRDDARLVVIIVSDEPDRSEVPVAAYVDFFRGVKGARGPGWVTVHAIANHPDDACADVSNDAADFSRYQTVARATGGQTQPICTDDWSGVMSSLGLATVQDQRDFALSRDADTTSLSVCVRATPSSPCVAVPQTNPDAAEGWFFVPATNSIRFNEGSIPPRGSRVELAYAAVCVGP
jgi:cysteine-rich repeat protein